MFTEKYSSHVGTFRAVNLKIGTACVATKLERQYFLKTYLASDIKVPILSFMRIDYVYDVYDLSCIQLLLVLYWHVALPYFYASVHANVIYIPFKVG